MSNLPNEIDIAIEQWKNGNYEHCFSVIESFATKGDPEAQFVLGESYSSGIWGKDKDITLAIYWYEQALKNSHIHASIRLAFIFDPTNQINPGKHKNSLKAKQYYKEAFKQYYEESMKGNAEAMYALSECYTSGNGVQHDLELAKYWMEKSCDLGFKLACIALGVSNY